MARHTGQAEIADLEIALLEVLEGAPGLVLGMAGQVDLAVFAARSRPSSSTRIEVLKRRVAPPSSINSAKPR